MGPRSLKNTQSLPQTSFHSVAVVASVLIRHISDVTSWPKCSNAVNRFNTRARFPAVGGSVGTGEMISSFILPFVQDHRRTECLPPKPLYDAERQ